MVQDMGQKEMGQDKNVTWTERKSTVSRASGKLRTYRVADMDAGRTAGNYLTRLGFTKKQISRMKFFPDGITVNGEKVRVTKLLQAGDLLTVRLEEEARGSDHLEAEAGALEILYEDTDLIAVWKPAGLVVHPAHGHFQDTLSNRLCGYFRAKGEAVQIRSIGRLDADTSGILVFAKNQVAAQRLWRQREDGSFCKEYRANCEGVFEEEAQRRIQQIDAPIAPAPGELMKMCVDPSGRRAVTRYRVLRQHASWAEVWLQLETGRTHQIRVHMEFIGHPLVGDPIYGNGKEGRTHAELCAFRARLRQPFSGEWIELTGKNEDRS